ncbi:hypothetical protein [uncultured Pseudoteredinibacter sp.]|uniref:hypothetical protein n=1 Tax=uncultured Pseudoteredinibacter sp. TaxID=1641701 RepID=UPI00262D69CC|nr:hypothetical protein [uncultured Pseudoteredinibacter sp.]
MIGFKPLILLTTLLVVACTPEITDREWEGLVVPSKYQTAPVKVYGTLSDSNFDTENRPLRLVVFEEELIRNVPAVKKIYRPDGGLFFLLFVSKEERKNNDQWEIQDWSTHIEHKRDTGYTRYYKDSNNWLMADSESNKVLGMCTKYLPNLDVKCVFRSDAGGYALEFTLYKENIALYHEISIYLESLIKTWEQTKGQ